MEIIQSPAERGFEGRAKFLMSVQLNSEAGAKFFIVPLPVVLRWDQNLKGPQRVVLNWVRNTSHTDAVWYWGKSEILKVPQLVFMRRYRKFSMSFRACSWCEFEIFQRHVARCGEAMGEFFKVHLLMVARSNSTFSKR
jgi:hypothetical protein